MYYQHVIYILTTQQCIGELSDEMAQVVKTSCHYKIVLFSHGPHEIPYKSLCPISWQHCKTHKLTVTPIKLLRVDNSIASPNAFWRFGRLPPKFSFFNMESSNLWKIWVIPTHCPVLVANVARRPECFSSHLESLVKSNPFNSRKTWFWDVSCCKSLPVTVMGQDRAKDQLKFPWKLLWHSMGHAPHRNSYTNRVMLLVCWYYVCNKGL